MYLKLALCLSGNILLGGWSTEVLMCLKLALCNFGIFSMRRKHTERSIFFFFFLLKIVHIVKGVESVVLQSRYHRNVSNSIIWYWPLLSNLFLRHSA